MGKRGGRSDPAGPLKAPAAAYTCVRVSSLRVVMCIWYFLLKSAC